METRFKLATIAGLLACTPVHSADYIISAINTNGMDATASQISETGAAVGTYFVFEGINVSCDNLYRRGIFIEPRSGNTSMLEAESNATCSSNKYANVLQSGINDFSEVAFTMNGVPNYYSNGSISSLEDQIESETGVISDRHVVYAISNNQTIAGLVASHAIANPSTNFEILRIGTFGSVWWESLDVNDNDVALLHGTNANEYHTFTIWENGTTREPSIFSTTEGYQQTYPTAINNKATVIGYSSLFDYTGFIAKGDSVVNTGEFGGSPVQPYGLNDADTVVGAAILDDENPNSRKAVIYAGGNWVDLNTLIQPGLGWELKHAYDVNNAGEIVGAGTLHGEQRAFRLTPISGVPDTYYIRGTFNQWKLLPLQYQPDGNYHAQITFMGSEEESLIKFDHRGDWSENFGDDNGDGIAERSGGDIVVANAPGTFDVTFNPATLAYTVTRIDESVSTYASMHVKTEFNGWQNNSMTLISDYVWQTTINAPSAGNIFFDVVGNWSTSFGRSFIDGEAELNGDAIALVGSGGDYNITFNDQTLAYTIELIGNNQPPTANAGSDISLIEGQIAQFDGSLSSDIDGSIIKYEWSNGLNGTKPTLQYATAGIYNVTLTVTDDDGAMSTDLVTVTVLADTTVDANYENMYLVGSFNNWALAEKSFNFGGSHQWYVEVDLSTNDLFKFVPYDNWSVSFGDQNKDGIADTNGGGDISVTGLAGRYRIDFNDSTLSYTVTLVNKVNKKPIANAGSNFTVEVFETFTLDGSKSTDADGEIVTYNWSNNAAPVASPSFSYDEIGTYVITLTVTDDEGATDTDTVMVTVTDVQHDSKFNAMHVTGTFNTWQLGANAMTLIADNLWQTSINFSGSDLFKFTPYTNWTLSFGDQNADGTADSAGGGDISHKLGSGVFIVEFNDKTLAYRIFKDPTNNIPPIANAGADINAEAGKPFTLNGSLSKDSDGRIVKYEWSNGAASTAKPSFTYNDAGNYTVTLTVTDDAGASHTDAVSIFVTEATPEPDNIYDAMAITGTFNNWVPGETQMTYKQNHIWEIQIELDANDKFKFTPYSNWSLSFGDKNADGIADSDGDGDISLPDGAQNYLISFNEKSLAYSIEAAGSGLSNLVANAGEDITVNINEMFNLDASKSTADDGFIVKIEWSNGAEGTLRPEFSYSEAGIYEVTLLVTDSNGNQDSDTVIITVLDPASPPTPPSDVEVTFTCHNGNTVWGQNVYVVGEAAELGSWNPENAILLAPTNYPSWSAVITLPANTALKWKCIKRQNGITIWQQGVDNSSNTGAGPAANATAYF